MKLLLLQLTTTTTQCTTTMHTMLLTRCMHVTPTSLKWAILGHFYFAFAHAMNASIVYYDRSIIHFLVIATQEPVVPILRSEVERL